MTLLLQFHPFSTADKFHFKLKQTVCHIHFSLSAHPTAHMWALCWETSCRYLQEGTGTAEAIIVLLSLAHGAIPSRALLGTEA